MLNGGYQMTREDKVNEFRKAAGKLPFEGAPEDADMICGCITEEFKEFVEATLDYEDAFDEDDDAAFAKARENLCKEWADLQYVVSQAALYYGIPADAAFNRVHNSNMTKVIGGKVIFREDGKILKPDTYQAPEMSGL